MTDRHIRVVSLWIHPGQEQAFEAFEREAARILSRHGGRIDHTVRFAQPAEPGVADPTPYELHIVSFPDVAAADSYATDPEALAFRQRRAQIIARTEVMAGREAGPY